MPLAFHEGALVKSGLFGQTLKIYRNGAGASRQTALL